MGNIKKVKQKNKEKKGNNAGEIKRRKIGSFTQKPFQQREIFSKGLKKYNILDTYNSFIYSSITELIKFSDNKNEANTKSDFYIKFPSNLNEREFNKLFNEGITAFFKNKNIFGVFSFLHHIYFKSNKYNNYIKIKIFII